MAQFSAKVPLNEWLIAIFAAGENVFHTIFVCYLFALDKESK